MFSVQRVSMYEMMRSVLGANVSLTLQCVVDTEDRRAICTGRGRRRVSRQHTLSCVIADQ